MAKGGALFFASQANNAYRDFVMTENAVRRGRNLWFCCHCLLFFGEGIALCAVVLKEYSVEGVC